MIKRRHLKPRNEALEIMDLVDTHCHIHSENYPLNAEDVIDRAKQRGVRQLICVGCSLEDSKRAVAFAGHHDQVWSSVGVHPHESDHYVNRPALLDELADLAPKPKVVAIGECGLDYFYHHADKSHQKEVLHFQIKLALKHNLPLIFHVRQAFDDFWPIFDSYSGIRGVVHSFTATKVELKAIIERGLYVSVNGIMTFTKQADQLETATLIPIERLLLETDAPFLTPTPYRGTINEPKYVWEIANFLSQVQGRTLEQMATLSTNNARTLFGLQ